MMSAMGMRQSASWIAWLCSSTMTAFVASMIVAALVAYGGILPYSAPGPVFAAAAVYAFAVIAFA